MTPKNAAAVALGRKGGQARAEKLTQKERSDSARKAVQARWAMTKKKIELSLRQIRESNERLEQAAKKRAKKGKP